MEYDVWFEVNGSQISPSFSNLRGADCADRLQTSMWIPLPRNKIEIMSSWKEHEIRRKSYLNIACVADAWKYWAQERTWRARETREGKGSACLRGLSRARSFLSPNTSKCLLRRLPQQNSLCELSASVTVIWAPYPLVGPVGIPLKLILLLLKIDLDGSSPSRFINTPLNSLYVTGICRCTGYGFFYLSVQNWVHNFVRVCQQGIFRTIDLIC